MNILPLIFVFLTILSLTSYSFLQERIASAKTSSTYRGYMRAERLSRNRLESIRYKKIPTLQNGNKTTGPKKKTEVFKSHRLDCPPTEASRLNITLLFSEQPPSFLYETLVKLIQDLYGHAPFFKEGNHRDLAYYVVNCMQNATKTSSFTEMFEGDPLYPTILYKMIKGTNHYQLDPKKGYPPLEDFLTLSPQKTKICLQFPYTSAPILTALWGAHVTEAIIQAEKKKWEVDQHLRTLLKDDLTPLLGTKVSPALQLGILEDHLSFHMKRPKRDQIKNTDSATHITIRKPENL